MKYKLVDHVRIVRLNNNNVYLISDEILELEGCNEEVYKSLIILENGCEKEDLFTFLDKQEVDDLIELLKEYKLLKENLENMYLNDIVEKQVYYFDHFATNSNELQRKLDSSKVAIL